VILAVPGIASTRAQLIPTQLAFDRHTSDRRRRSDRDDCCH
jgi:hypothetical protein